MADHVDLGIHGIAVRPGDHICGLYFGDDERDAIMLPFIEAGLRAGDKCICVVDGIEPTELLTAIDANIGARARADTRQLEVMRSTDAYLRSGSFGAQETIGFWKAAISDAMYDGRFDLVRAVETWGGRDLVPDTRELMSLESEMSNFLALYPQVVLCLYDLERFGGGVVVDLVKTHPKLLLRGAVVDNPYWLRPDELLDDDGGK